MGVFLIEGGRRLGVRGACGEFGQRRCDPLQVAALLCRKRMRWVDPNASNEKLRPGVARVTSPDVEFAVSLGGAVSPRKHFLVCPRLPPGYPVWWASRVPFPCQLARRATTDP